MFGTVWKFTCVESPFHTQNLPRKALVACKRARSVSRVRLFKSPWTAAHQAPVSMGLSQQEYWSGLPFTPPGYLPHPRIKLPSPGAPALAGGFFTTEPPGKPKGANYLAEKIANWMILRMVSHSRVGLLQSGRQYLQIFDLPKFGNMDNVFTENHRVPGQSLTDFSFIFFLNLLPFPTKKPGLFHFLRIQETMMEKPQGNLR